MKEIAQGLLDWHYNIERDLPWKDTDDPYFIWLSEIILQQTRVEQGRQYYLKFIEVYPKVFDLANAPEDEVLKNWEGLGYYSRARNLHAAAKYIAFDLKGVFPSSYEEILKLKGVGPYTAAAIASFAYNLPFAVLDGNVFRVLSRLYDVSTDILSHAGKKEFAQLAAAQLGDFAPAAYNQAIMDFGALICTPSPKCEICPLIPFCESYKNQTQKNRPIKKKAAARKKRYFYYLFLQIENQVALQKREDQDIWKGLYQFPLIEKNKKVKPNLIEWETMLGIDGLQHIRTWSSQKQILSHQEIHATFIQAKIDSQQFILNKGYFLVNQENVGNFAFPKIMTWFLDEKAIYLFE